MEPETKKSKVDSEPDASNRFAGFETERVLAENSRSKTIFIQGKFAGAGDNRAVVLVERKPLSRELVGSMLTGGAATKTVLHNDIYHTLDLYPPSHCASVKATLIYPATDRHIAKYTSQPGYLISETPEDYESLTKPYLDESTFSVKWVHNILEKKSEAERVVFEDADPETGFVLLPDMKWSAEVVEDLYLVAIVHRRDLRSLRDLTADHLPLLNNILNKGKSAIKSRYGVAGSRLRIYLHYLPSYYHLHVHFTHLSYDAPGSGVERAHLLTDVIGHLQREPLYFQNTTLSYVLHENEGLLQRFRDNGRVED